MRPSLVVAALVLGLFATLFAALDHAAIAGDGLAIYVLAESILLDGDFDLANQHERYREQVRQIASYALVEAPGTGRYASHWPFGMALLWAPFLYYFWSLDAAGTFASPYVLYGLPLPGRFRAIGLAMVWAANFWGVAAWAFAARTASRAVAGWEAQLVALAVFLGTPLFFYVTIEPSYSHVGDAVTVAALLWAWSGFRRDSWAHGVLAGALAGLAILVRWQLFTYAVALGASSLLLREWRRLGGLVLGVAALTWPISYSWYVMGGSMVRPPILDVVPNYLGTPKMLDLLVSDLRGLLPWSPVAALGLLGLVAGLRRHRRQATELLACVAGQLVINGMIWDWWAGHSFGNRRLVSLYAILVVGTAWLIEQAGDAAQRWGHGTARAARLALLTLSGLLAWHSFVLGLYYYPSRLDPTTMTHSQLARQWKAEGDWAELTSFYRGHQRTLGVVSLRVEPPAAAVAPAAPPTTAPEPGHARPGRPAIDAVEVRPGLIVVRGGGFREGLVVNVFQQQGGTTVNLGGLTAQGLPVIARPRASAALLEFPVPAGLRRGPFYVEVVNPPHGPANTSPDVPAAHASLDR
jgi:hypothetical protein